MQTLIDITETGARRSDEFIAFGQQSNYNTVIQTIGLRANPLPKNLEKITVDIQNYSFGESITYGTSFGYWTLMDYISQFKYVFTKEGATQVGGFGAIGKLFPKKWDWQLFWMNTALISIILAFMNKRTTAVYI